MFEREEGQERSIEEILAVTLETIQPVLVGDKRRIEIFKDGEDPVGRTPIVEFYPVSGIGRETAREVIKRLVEKLGADLTTGKEISYEPTDLSGLTARAIYHYPTEKFRNIVVTAELIKPWDAGYYWVRTLGIENLHPKPWHQKAKEKVQAILGLEEQFVQV